MEKTEQKLHSSSQLSKRVSQILGLHNGDSLALYKQLSQMDNGPVKDALDTLCAMIEESPMEPEYTFLIYGEFMGGNSHAARIAAHSRHEAKLKMLQQLGPGWAEEDISLTLERARLVPLREARSQDGKDS